MYNKPLKIEVREDKNIRTLYVNGMGQSAIDLSDANNFVFEYMKYFSFPFILTDVKSALFIGGGGFTGPRIFASQGISVDAVEVDHELVKIAREKFGADSSKFNIIVSDGLKFLETCDKKYDVIIVDAFVANKTPLHLQNSEFFSLAAKHLTPTGVFLSNNITAPGASLFMSLYTDLSEFFGCIYAFDNDPPSPQSRNIILVACNMAPLSVAELLERNKKSKVDFSAELKENLFASD